MYSGGREAYPNVITLHIPADMGEDMVTPDLKQQIGGVKPRFLCPCDGFCLREKTRHIGELPQPREKPAVRAFLDGVAILAIEHKDGAVFLLSLPLGQLHRQGAPLILPQTEPGAGTHAALWLAVGQTHRGTQFHQGLGKGTGIVGGVDGFKLLLHLCFGGRQVDGGLVPADPGYYPQHIAVHGGTGLPEGDGADGAGGVCADPGQGKQALVVLGKHPAIFRHNDLSRFFQVAHPGVIAQSLPQLVQAVVLAGSKGLDIRQRRQKTEVVALDGLHPGLLEHDLRQPDVVRLPILPPRQIPPVFGVPSGQHQGEPAEQFLQNIPPLS